MDNLLSKIHTCFKARAGRHITGGFIQVRLDVGAISSRALCCFCSGGSSLFSRSFYLEAVNIFQLRLPGGGNAIAAPA
ncbi:MAG: hypothetical protein ACR2KZ_03500 [Segetibacter sp.]